MLFRTIILPLQFTGNFFLKEIIKKYIERNILVKSLRSNLKSRSGEVYSTFVYCCMTLGLFPEVGVNKLQSIYQTLAYSQITNCSRTSIFKKGNFKEFKSREKNVVVKFEGATQCQIVCVDLLKIYSFILQTAHLIPVVHLFIKSFFQF